MSQKRYEAERRRLFITALDTPAQINYTVARTGEALREVCYEH